MTQADLGSLRRTAIACIVFACIAGCGVWRDELAELSIAAESAQSTQELAEVLRRIILSEDTGAALLLRELDRKNPRLAFDGGHAIAVLHDGEGQTFVVGKRENSSFEIDEPHVAFDTVRLLRSDQLMAVFALEPADDGDAYQVEFDFNQDGLMTGQTLRYLRDEARNSPPDG